MANTHNHAPFRKSILVPFWALQLFFMIAIIGLLSLAVGVLVSNSDLLEDDGYTSQSVDTATKIIAPVWISLSALCMILTITEIVLLARHKLMPLFFLISNIIKSTIWTGLFILDVMSLASASGRTVSIIGMIIDVILLLSFLGPLIYSSGIYHSHRRQRKAYKPVDPTQSTSFNPQSSSEFGHFVTIAPGTPDLEAGRNQETGFQSFNGRKVNQPEYSAMDRTTTSPPYFSPVPDVYVQNTDGQVFEMESQRNRVR